MTYCPETYTKHTQLNVIIHEGTTCAVAKRPLHVLQTKQHNIYTSHITQNVYQHAMKLFIDVHTVNRLTFRAGLHAIECEANGWRVLFECVFNYPAQCVVVVDCMLQYLKVVAGESKPNKVAWLSMKVVCAGRVRWQCMPRAEYFTHTTSSGK